MNTIRLLLASSNARFSPIPSHIASHRDKPPLISFTDDSRRFCPSVLTIFHYYRDRRRVSPSIAWSVCVCVCLFTVADAVICDCYCDCTLTLRHFKSDGLLQTYLLPCYLFSPSLPLHFIHCVPCACCVRFVLPAPRSPLCSVNSRISSLLHQQSKSPRRPGLDST